RPPLLRFSVFAVLSVPSIAKTAKGSAPPGALPAPSDRFRCRGCGPPDRGRVPLVAPARPHTPSRFGRVPRVGAAARLRRLDLARGGAARARLSPLSRHTALAWVPAARARGACPGAARRLPRGARRRDRADG